MHIENTAKFICIFCKLWSSQGRIHISTGSVFGSSAPFWKFIHVRITNCHHCQPPSISSPHSCFWICVVNLIRNSPPSSPAPVTTGTGRIFGQTKLYLVIRNKMQTLHAQWVGESPCSTAGSTTHPSLISANAPSIPDKQTAAHTAPAIALPTGSLAGHHNLCYCSERIWECQTYSIIHKHF